MSRAGKTSVAGMYSSRERDHARKGNQCGVLTSSPFGYLGTVYREISIVPCMRWALANGYHVSTSGPTSVTPPPVVEVSIQRDLSFSTSAYDILWAYGNAVTTGQDNVSASTVKYPRKIQVAEFGPTAGTQAAAVFPTVCYGNVRGGALSPYQDPGGSRIDQTLYVVYSLQAFDDLKIPMRPRIFAIEWKRSLGRSSEGQWDSCGGPSTSSIWRTADLFASSLRDALPSGVEYYSSLLGVVYQLLLFTGPWAVFSGLRKRLSVIHGR